VLNRITSTGMNTYNVFAYDSYGEMTNFTTPLGGAMGWTYNKSNYATTSRRYMEVTARTLQPSYGAATYSWSVNLGADYNGLHGTGTVQDATAQSEKVWTFNTSTTALAPYTVYPDELIGQLTQYQEISTATNQATLQKNFTPVQSSGGQPYFGTVTTILSPGSSQAQTTTVQTLDTHGNLTQSQAYDYGSSSPTRTYNFYYLTGSNYTSRYIFNRLTSATVTPSGGSAVTLVTNSYDDNPTAYSARRRRIRPLRPPACRRRRWWRLRRDTTRHCF
jgi:hypothetical protein